MKSVSLILPFLLFSTVSFGQGTDPLGTNRPTTYTISSLPNELIALDVTTSKDNLMSLLQLSMGGGMITGPDSGRPSITPEMMMHLANIIWATKEDVNTGGGEFLIGYKLDAPISPRAAAGISPAALKFRLTYVRRSAIIALTPREDFLPSTLKELAKEPTPLQASASDRTSTLSNLKQTAVGLIILLSDNDDNFPYVQSTPQLFEFMMPYIKNKEVYKTRNPIGGDFRFNMSLAGATMSEIERPAETPMFYESQAWPDGKRCVAYTDGHAKIVSTEDWDKLQPLLKLKLTKHGKPLKPGDPLSVTKDMSVPTPPARKKKGGGL